MIEDIKRKVIRGGVAKLVAQAFALTLRLLFLVIVARLLSPEDFGLVAMVTAITGVMGVLRDGGLSAAAIQRAHITQDQQSTLFLD